MTDTPHSTGNNGKQKAALADAIERTLRLGARSYLLQGAELDWVAAALRTDIARQPKRKSWTRTATRQSSAYRGHP